MIAQIKKQFAENGEIYQMVVGEKGVNIYRLYKNMSGKAIGFAEREYEQLESDNVETFVSNINNGMFAGNVCCDYTQRQVGGTVGMDCSGYVSVAFDLPSKHGTGNLHSCFSALQDYNAVQPYDILNKANNHVMIVIGTYVSNGVRYVNTIEETKSAGKVVQTTNRNYASLLNSGFIPMRYNYLQ